jgi:Cu-processing system permease protein
MWKILKYSFYDLMRSRWVYIYFGFYLVLTLALFAVSSNLNQVVLSLMNIILVLVPLVATLFGVTYYYHTREFTELLLAQPLKRSHIFLGQYVGLAGSLAFCLALGVGAPFLIFGVVDTGEVWNYFSVLFVGVILTFIFSAISTLVALHNDNKIRGFGIAVLLWLVFAVIYDGIFVILLSYFSDYPLEKFAISMLMFNPIDLGRILITLQLDVAALMGYTGAVLQKTIGSGMGRVLAWAVLLLWIVLPVFRMNGVASRKDF